MVEVKDHGLEIHVADCKSILTIQLCQVSIGPPRIMMGLATKTTTFILVTLVCNLLLPLPATEGWVFGSDAKNEEQESGSSVPTTKLHTTPTIDPTKDEQHLPGRETSTFSIASGDLSVEQDLEDGATGVFTTRKEGLVPPATDAGQDTELDEKRETELDMEFIVVTTPKMPPAANKTSSTEADADKQNVVKLAEASSISTPQKHEDATTPASSKEAQDTIEDYSDVDDGREILLAVAGSGDIDDDLYEVTTTATTADSHEESMAVATEAIIVHEEGSDLEASPDHFTTGPTHAPEQEPIAQTEAVATTPVKDDRDTVKENTLDTATVLPRKTRRPRPRPRVTPRPNSETPRPPKVRKAPGAAIDIPDKPTTRKHSGSHLKEDEPPLSTPSPEEVIIGHRNATNSGLSLAAKTGIAAGCVVAFWLILGPIVCCLCRMKDTPKELPPEPAKACDGTNVALVEEMVVAELARGRDKKYNTTVENEQEITPLNHTNHTDNPKKVTV